MMPHQPTLRRLMSPWTLTLAATLLLLLACQGRIDSKPVDPTLLDPDSPLAKDGPLEPLMTEEALREHAGLEPQGRGQLAALPADQVRLRKRLDLDQLDASLRRVSGGLGWTVTRNGQEVNQLEELASTLGKPDYINNTSEDLEPSIIFQKFLGDAARSVCDRVVEREAQATTPSPSQDLPALFIHISPEQDPRQAMTLAQDNLRALLLRFHGRFIRDNDDPQLKPWSWLLESTLHTGAQPAEAWRAVCVGLITHPDFYMY